MAFQDSTGGIVLDAVLTDLGRKKLAQGNFRVTKFALGDDEIDYSYYKITSTGYDDSDVIATPVLEAFGGQQSNIQYGLQNFIRKDIIYYPSLKVNTIVDGTVAPSGSQLFYHLAANKETARKLKTALSGENYVLVNGKVQQTKLVIESGIDCDPDGLVPVEVIPSAINKERFLIQMGLYDKYFLAYCDNRFISKILTSPENSLFENDIANNLYMNLGILQESVEVSLPSVSDKHSVYRIAATDNNILYHNSTTINTQSSLEGPRSTVFAINFKLHNEMTSDSQGTADFKYSKFGTTSNALFGTADLYDFIDTTIYIQGLSSDARLSIPIRIVRYAGT
tara:strand:- start:1214 stop:2227 length:1014 start_codon:yes stop_codon:yes gene_type:complete